MCDELTNFRIFLIEIFICLVENHATLAYLRLLIIFFRVFLKKKFSVNFYILISRNRYKIRRWFCLFLTEVPPWDWAKCKNKPRIKSENLWNRCIILMPAMIWQILIVNPSIYRKRKCFEKVREITKVNKPIRR